jgi:hypothetical protein
MITWCLCTWKTNIFPDAADMGFVFAGGVSLPIAMLMASLVTVLIHRFGMYVSVLIGISLQTVGLIVASIAMYI